MTYLACLKGKRFGYFINLIIKQLISISVTSWVNYLHINGLSVKRQARIFESGLLPYRYGQT